MSFYLVPVSLQFLWSPHFLGELFLSLPVEIGVLLLSFFYFPSQDGLPIPFLF